MLKPRDLSVVIVLYNSADAIVDTVASVPAEAELILVDNGSSDDGLQRALRRRPDARWRREPNHGFGAGCNRGAELAGRPVVLFLNPDAELAPTTVDALLGALTREPRAVVGAVHMIAPGEPLGNARRRSQPHHEVLELLPSAERWLPSRWRRDVPLSDPIYDKGGIVPYVQGACFALRRQTLLDAGGFDERYFLYSEEEDLADRVAARGGRSLLVADAQIHHAGEASTSRVALFALGHIYRSRVIFYASRDGMATALGFCLLLGLAAAIHLMAQLVRAREAPSQSWACFRAVLCGALSGLAQARRPRRLLVAP